MLLKEGNIMVRTQRYKGGEENGNSGNLGNHAKKCNCGNHRNIGYPGDNER
jgi:hypothetical protein